MNPEQHKQSTDVPSAGLGQKGNGQARESSNGESDLDGLRSLQRQLASDTVGSYDLQTLQGIKLAQEQEALLDLISRRRKQEAEAAEAESKAAKAAHQAKAEPGRLKVRGWKEWSYLAIVILVAVIGIGLVVYGLIWNPALISVGVAVLLTSGAAAGLGLSKAHSVLGEGSSGKSEI